MPGAKSPPLYPAANPERHRGQRHRSAGQAVLRVQPRQLHRAAPRPASTSSCRRRTANTRSTSGTSFSAAYVSGVAALLLERNHALKPEALRMTLAKTARDLGAPGRDDLFGDGQADAFAAVMAAPTDSATPVAAASGATALNVKMRRTVAMSPRQPRAAEQPSLSSAAPDKPRFLRRIVPATR